MDGKPVRYRLNSDGTFILYSVGEDGVDNGGDPTLRPEIKELKGLWYRKDFVWPAQATAKEVEEYRKKPD
jgi:hypothetical protein